MPIADRDYVRGKHPPTCTCKECVRKRLKKSNLSLHTPSTFPRIALQQIRYRVWHKIPISIRKIFLCLAVITDLGILTRNAYLLFTHQTIPVLGTIIFLAEVGILIWLISILRNRRYRWQRPSFKLVCITLVAISLVCTFAGIEPMASYKDHIFTSVNSTFEQWKLNREKDKAEIEAQERTREAKLKAEEQSRMEAESLARARAEERAKLETETEAIERARRQEQMVAEAEHLAFEFINQVRMLEGILPTKWDDELYQLSKAHTQFMADRGELIHSPETSLYGENCWGGFGSHLSDSAGLAEIIVSSWMTSPLHKAWILHKPFQTSVVSIISTPDGQWASWTFWTNEAGEGPELVRKIKQEWVQETGKKIPWIDWLYLKGYLY